MAEGCRLSPIIKQETYLEMQNTAEILDKLPKFDHLFATTSEGASNRETACDMSANLYSHIALFARLVQNGNTSRIRFKKYIQTTLSS